MLIERVHLGPSYETTREVVKSNINQQVILQDDHEGLAHAQILGEVDSDRYRVLFGDARGERNLHYHDLQELIVIGNHPHFPRPEMKR